MARSDTCVLVAAAILQVGCLLDTRAETANYAALTGYYGDVVTEDAVTLRQSLHSIIRHQEKRSYSDTWDILEEADQDPNDPSRIIDVYLNQSYKIKESSRPYNREHTWPKSYGFPKNNLSNLAYTDCHALFLSHQSYNGSRGNKPFDTCDELCSDRPTVDGSPNRTNDFVWETWSGRRGDVARAALYMDVRYEGDFANEPDLILTDDMALVEPTFGQNAEIAYMGRLEVLLQWHKEDPVDERELHRNEVIFAAQGNRNPFIDHPEWVGCIFKGQCSVVAPTDPVDPVDPIDPTDPTDPIDPTVPVESAPRIVEIHYDNTGSDIAEFVGLEVLPNADLGGWSVVGYNGKNGAPYQEIPLESAIVNETGQVWLFFPGLQNGDADGIALISPQGDVVEALSYEGQLWGKSGPASGVAFTDIGVSENSKTKAGFSLQLIGGSWVGPLPQQMQIP